MCTNPQGAADLVTFPEEILNGKIHFLCRGLVMHHAQIFLAKSLNLNSIGEK